VPLAELLSKGVLVETETGGFGGRSLPPPGHRRLFIQLELRRSEGRGRRRQLQFKNLNTGDRLGSSPPPSGLVRSQS
jgi:hypothetical protein